MLRRSRILLTAALVSAGWAAGISLAAQALVTQALGARELPEPEEIRRRVDEVLALPEFQPPERSWLQRAREWVLERIGEIAQQILEKIGIGLSKPAVVPLVITLLCAVLIVILARMIHRLVIQRDRRPRAAGKSAPSAAPAAPGSEPQLDLARRRAAEGKFLEAMHALYLGVLLHLHGARRVRFEESKTGGEYQAELRGSPLAAPFGGILRSFYPVAFGGRPAAGESYAAMREEAQRLGVPA